MNLLLVEDDVDNAAQLAAALRAIDHDVTVAHDGRTALQAVADAGFDAIILDCMLPEIDGLSVVRQLRAREQRLPVLMLSALGRSLEKVDGLNAGADDYVVKPTPASEIDARLRALLRARGWTGNTTDAVRAGDLRLSPGQHRAWREERALDLTRLEFRLLAELVRHAGSYLTRAMLLERVWGYDFEPATNIVDVHVRSLRRKLTQAGEEDPIVTKRGVGYMLAV